MNGVKTHKPDTGFLPVLPPRFALVELALFAAVIAAEYLFDGFPDLSRLNPHPYWIAVLLLSLQYGTVSGLLAAALAIGGTLLLGLPDAEIGESYFNYLVRVWTQPVLWIVVALLLGSFRMRQIEEREGLQKQVDDATVQSLSLSGYARDLKTRVDMLERRLSATAKPETARLLEAFDAMAAPATATAPERARLAVKTAFDIVCPGAAVSIMVADGAGFRQILDQNWPDQAPWRPHLKADDPLSLALEHERRVYSVLNASDDLILGRDAKVVVPILGDGRNLLGLLRVEAITAADLDQKLMARLLALSRALAPFIAATTTTAPQTDRAVIPMLRRSRASAPHEADVPSMKLTRPPIEPGA